MLRLRWLAVCAITGCASTQAGKSDSPLISRYDRISGTTTHAVRVEPKARGNALIKFELIAAYLVPDTSQGKPSTIGVQLHASTDYRDGTWQFLQTNGMALLLDGTTRVTYPGARGGTVGKYAIEETMTVPLTATQFRSIANAQSIEGRVGAVEFTLSPADISRLRTLATQAAAAQ